MTLRERKLMITLLGGLGVLVGGYLVYSWFLVPLREANQNIAKLEEDIAKQDQLIRRVKLEQKKLEKYKTLSLPSNPDQAASDYAKFLKPLLRSSGLTVDDLQGPPPGSLKPPVTQGKKTGHMILAFTVRARGDVGATINTLEALKMAPVAHRVKSLTIAPADSSGKDTAKLNIQMTIEALIVNKADSLRLYVTDLDQRLVMLESLTAMVRGPGGMALGPWAASREAMRTLVASEYADLDRNYDDIPHRNLFAGAKIIPKPVEIVEGPIDGGLDVRKYIHLVQTDPTSKEAFLRNYVFKTQELRLRPKTGSGYDTFRIFNEDRDRELLKGKVLRVDQRDVFFQVAEEIYGIHIGQSLADALRRPLSIGELEDLELTELFDEKFAEQSAPAKKKNSKAPTKGKTRPK